MTKRGQFQSCCCEGNTCLIYSTLAFRRKPWPAWTLVSGTNPTLTASGDIVFSAPGRIRFTREASAIGTQQAFRFSVTLHDNSSDVEFYPRWDGLPNGGLYHVRFVSTDAAYNATLDYPVVHIVGMQDGTYPHYEYIWDKWSTDYKIDAQINYLDGVAHFDRFAAATANYFREPGIAVWAGTIHNSSLTAGGDDVDINVTSGSVTIHALELWSFGNGLAGCPAIGPATSRKTFESHSNVIPGTIPSVIGVTFDSVNYTLNIREQVPADSVTLPYEYADTGEDAIWNPDFYRGSGGSTFSIGGYITTPYLTPPPSHYTRQWLQDPTLTLYNWKSFDVQTYGYLYNEAIYYDHIDGIAGEPVSVHNLFPIQFY